MSSIVPKKDSEPRKETLLVMDDDPKIHPLIDFHLEGVVEKILHAESPLVGLRMAKEHLPDVVLLDIDMPRMDGYQVCKVITGNDAFRHIPVVMLSGKDGFFDKVRGRMVGAKDYITKPFETDALVKSVRKQIETPSK